MPGPGFFISSRLRQKQREAVIHEFAVEYGGHCERRLAVHSRCCGNRATRCRCKHQSDRGSGRQFQWSASGAFAGTSGRHLREREREFGGRRCAVMSDQPDGRSPVARATSWHLWAEPRLVSGKPIVNRHRGLSRLLPRRNGQPPWTARRRSKGRSRRQRDRHELPAARTGVGNELLVAVSAVDTTGNESPLSAPLSVALTQTPPTPPTAVVARLGGDRTNVLMWALSEDDD